MSATDEAVPAVDAAAADQVIASDAPAADGIAAEMINPDEFYLRYYVGHHGAFGHEFLEFELRPNGLLRYANNSSYKGDRLILKEVTVSPSVMNEIRRIVAESEIMGEDDSNWPEATEDGRQDIEIILGGSRISFVTSKLGSLIEVEQLECAESIKRLYYLVQDLRCFVISLISLHFKINPYATTVRS